MIGGDGINDESNKMSPAPNAVFLEYCVFLKRAIFEKALYDFMRDEG